MGRFGKALFATSVLALAPLAPAQAAITWSYDWAAADAYIGVAGPSVRPLSNPTDEVRFTAESVVRFIDDDRSGDISVGDTFIDYIVLRFDALWFGGADNGETAAGYAAASNGRQITLAAVFSGTQVAAGRYEVSPGGTADIYYDAGTGYTAASFASLATFTDSNGGPGNAIERGTVVAPSGGLNNSQTLPDGKIDVRMLLDDTLLPGGFEVAPGSGTPLGTAYAWFDADNVLCNDSGGRAACESTTGALLSFFGVPQMGANQFEFHTRTDRSMTKVLAAAIPEPGSLGLLGVALLGWGAARRRGARRRQGS